MRIGTRGSALALAQAGMVRDALGGGEIVTITTTGDRNRALADKAKWVTELERALADGEIDIAVHSAKDVPTTLPDGLELVGCLPREDPRDAVCGVLSVDGRPARVGTASLRRAAQLRSLPAIGEHQIEVVEIRGNVDTRLGKLAGGEVDAVVLALAGLKRLGREDAVDSVLDDLVPAAGQGTVVIEARAGFELELKDAPTWRALSAERACIHALGADCASAVGAHLRPDGTLVAWVGSVDGAAWLRDELLIAPDADPVALGVEVGERLLSAGARDLLDNGTTHV